MFFLTLLSLSLSLSLLTRFFRYQHNHIIAALSRGHSTLSCRLCFIRLNKKDSWNNRGGGSLVQNEVLFQYRPRTFHANKTVSRVQQNKGKKLSKKRGTACNVCSWLPSGRSVVDYHSIESKQAFQIGGVSRKGDRDVLFFLFRTFF